MTKKEIQMANRIVGKIKKEYEKEKALKESGKKKNGERFSSDITENLDILVTMFGISIPELSKQTGIRTQLIGKWLARLNTKTVEDFGLTDQDISYGRRGTRFLPDGRTIGVCVKLMIEDNIGPSELASTIGVSINSLGAWKKKYEKYYKFLSGLPVGLQVTEIERVCFGLEAKLELEEHIRNNQYDEETHRVILNKTYMNERTKKNTRST